MREQDWGLMHVQTDQTRSTFFSLSFQKSLSAMSEPESEAWRAVRESRIDDHCPAVRRAESIALIGRQTWSQNFLKRKTRCRSASDHQTTIKNSRYIRWPARISKERKNFKSLKYNLKYNFRDNRWSKRIHFSTQLRILSVPYSPAVYDRGLPKHKGRSSAHGQRWGCFERPENWILQTIWTCPATFSYMQN